ALGTSTYPVDPAYPVTTAPMIKANLEAFPGGWPIFLNSDGQNLKQLTENHSGGNRPNFDEAWFFWNSFPEFGSGIPGNFLFDLGVGDGTLPGRDGVAVDNSDTVYQVDLDPGLSDYEIALNEAIFRVEADKNARRVEGIKNVRQVTGDFRIPVLTMHNLGDLFVPFHNEVAYHDDAVAAGTDDLLVQRAIRGVNHCGFTVSEYETAMTDLVAWVEEGTKPQGDDVGNPVAVAGPEFGCKFTDFDTPGGHILATPCP
ncbi:MAG: alpha/beta hydrolase, partial [Actinomycetota bacterium]|nr:alpha/beta hydrolase [Actinomycetota bacterium]